ncbi:MAG: electron transfer flavoprotein subunit beta/FixA family protein [Solirubrobacteraceae bacterium]
MKIVVAVKQVAALDDEFELLDGGSGVDPDSLEWDLNEWDTFSVEAALVLREAAGGEVVVVTVGEEEAEEGLLSCLAKGADRAVRVWDDALADTGDALAIARVLAAVIERESPDLVLCGVQSSDAVNGATGVAVAGFLGLPHVAVVKGLAHDAAAGSVTVERELEGGLVERLRIGLPALLTIQTGINEPRYANLRAIKQAREKPMEVTDLNGIGLDGGQVAAAAGAHRLALAEPDRGEGAEMLAGSAGDVAARIAEIVRERMAS